MARKRFAARAARRSTVWLSLDPVDVTLPAASTAVLTHTLNAAALALRPFTIVRTRLHWFLESDQVAASENYMAAVGISVVSDQAAAVGITGVPRPFADLGSDNFFYHEIQSGSFVFGSGVGFIEEVRGVNTDSKAMRKVNEADDVAVVVENSSLGAGSFIRMAGRMLVKFH